MIGMPSQTVSPDLQTFLGQAVQLTESALDQVMPPARTPPAKLHQAMRYSVMAGGKRIRPALVLAACRACAGQDASAAPAIAAVELLHTYTLIHDDLPAMDDDDLRRGRPTCHKVYGEACAILAGDALQTLAFESVSELGSDAVRALAQAAGSQGVIGGQQDDIDSEGVPLNEIIDLAGHLERIHRGKTAALIRVSCELGAIAAGSSTQQQHALANYGETIGLAFQVIDDILDVTATADQLGKTPGKDAATGKLTYVAVHGLDAAREEAERLRREAAEALTPLGEQARDLELLGTYIVERSV